MTQIQSKNGTSSLPAPAGAGSEEVVARPTRRRFSAQYKLRIVHEAERCAPGELGALLRREGLYASHLTSWRKQRETGALAALAGKKRGPKVDPQGRRPGAPATRERQAAGQAGARRPHHRRPKKVAGAAEPANPRRARSEVTPVLDELAAAVGVKTACEALGVPRSSRYAARRPRVVTERAPAPPPPRALAACEKAKVRETLNSDRFADQAPREVYATLLDEGVYHCSVPTMYRILRENAEVVERRSQLRHPAYAKPRLSASGPNQVWSWDITKLLGPAVGLYFYLYVLLDLFSRFVVGWLVAEREVAALAEQLIAESCLRQLIARDQLTLHSDRGAPMTAKSLSVLLTDLGVTPSLARPRLPDDNAFSEAQFKTVKYHPTFPGRFGGIQDARTWCQQLFRWYNHEHHHTALGLMTPAAVHTGEAPQLHQQRQVVLAAAFAAHPERFVRGLPQPPALPAVVWLNPPPEEKARSDTAQLH